MNRFTLPKALVSLTCFGLAAGMLRLAIRPYEAEFRLLFLIVGCITALLAFGVLIDEIELSVLLGIALAVTIAFVTTVAAF